MNSSQDGNGQVTPDPVDWRSDPILVYFLSSIICDLDDIDFESALHVGAAYAARKIGLTGQDIIDFQILCDESIDILNAADEAEWRPRVEAASQFLETLYAHRHPSRWDEARKWDG